jgi:hypothetical protein
MPRLTRGGTQVLSIRQIQSAFGLMGSIGSMGIVITVVRGRIRETHSDGYPPGGAAKPDGRVDPVPGAVTCGVIDAADRRRQAGGMHRYDRTLRVVMWWDAFLSTALALLCVVASPVVAMFGMPHGIVLGVGLAAVGCAVLLAAFGAVTAVAFVLRLRSGDWSMPSDLRLPLPRQLRPGSILGPRFSRSR